MRRFIRTRLLLHLLVLGTAALLGSCDSGDIIDTHYTVNGKGHNVKLTASLHGLASLPAGYTLALAGFQEGSNYAVMQRAIPAGAGADSLQLVLANVGSNVQTVELAVTNNLRERILSLASVKLDDYEGQTDTIRLDMGVLDVSATGCLQRGMLDKACVQCHGANGRKAAGLDLTEGYTSADLVNEGSLLWHILNDGGENILHYNHTEVISSQFKDNLAEVRTYLRKWIEAQPAATDK